MPYVPRLLALAVQLAAAPVPAQTYTGASVFSTPNLVTNGDFERVIVTSSTHWALAGDPNRADWGMPVPSEFGWRVTGSVDIHNVERSGWIRTPNGVQSLELNGNTVADANVWSGVWQEIATEPGTRYTLQFLLYGWSAGNAQVWWNGSVVPGSPSTGSLLNRIGAVGNGFSLWEFRDLIASGPTTTLGFRSLVQNSGGGPIIDDVRLFAQPAVVPEPSTTALLATGLAGLGVVARRRRAALPR